MATLQYYLRSALTALEVFRRALAMVWRSNPRDTALSIALNFIQAGLPFGIFYLTKLLIDQLVEGISSKQMNAGDLAIYLAGFGAVWLANGLVGILAHWLQHLHQLRFNDYIAGIIQEKSISLDLAYYETPELQDTFHKAQYEAAYRPWQLLQSVHQLIQSAFFLALVMALLFALAWWLVPVLLLAGVPGLLVRIYYSRKFYDVDRQRAQRERESWHLHELLTQVPAARELRLFRFGGIMQRRYRKLREQLYMDKSRLLSKQARSDVFTQLVEVLTLTGLIGWVAFRAIAGALSVGSLVMYLQAFQRALGQLRTAVSALSGLYSHRLFLSYLFDFLDIEARIQDPAQPAPLPGRIQEGFQVKNLDFTYPNQSKPVLKNINLELRHGERIAIVGPNGSGKSTLIKLLARFYDPAAGHILLDGIDVRACTQDDLRSRMSIVFQDFNRYPFTAAENIRISDLHREPDMNEVQRAAQQSGAARTIERLAQGYDTRLGYTFDGGAELSGGQWQQVAIARAFYADKQILILDEPMSAIDPLVEHAIFEEIFKLDRNRLIIFITHRLYHLQQADRIIVMQEGQIAEQGPFDSLMEQKGLFYQLFRSQQVTPT